MYSALLLRVWVVTTAELDVNENCELQDLVAGDWVDGGQEQVEKQKRWEKWKILLVVIHRKGDFFFKFELYIFVLKKMGFAFLFF